MRTPSRIPGGESLASEPFVIGDAGTSVPALGVPGLLVLAAALVLAALLVLRR